jgi:hypothetical protein
MQENRGKRIDDEFSGVPSKDKRWALRHPEKAVARWQGRSREYVAQSNKKQREKPGARERHAIGMAEWRRAHPGSQEVWNRKYYDKIKKMVFDHYGWVCRCCGETEEAFLTIDHINNDGAQHSKRHNPDRNRRSYKWYVKEGFPSDLQTLCWNCNSAKRKYGECPHKTQDYSDRLGVG